MYIPVKGTDLHNTIRQNENEHTPADKPSGNTLDYTQTMQTVQSICTETLTPAQRL